MNQSEIDDWCDENLPEIYHTAMFDFEEVADRVWEEFNALIAPFENLLTDTVLDHFTETAHAWMKAHHELVLSTCLEPVAEQQLQQLVLQRQTPQHVHEWYAEKSECLTASEIHDIFSGSRAALLRRKVALYRSRSGDDDGDGVGRSTVSVSQADGNMMATYWGHRFEPIIRRIFEEEKSGRDTVLDGLGRFRHADPAFEWLRASPDGLVMRGPLAGRLVEIKAPKTRVPDDLVPSEYWIQMQMQAEVLNLDAVEFVEAQFQQRHKSAMTAEDWGAFEAAKWKGEIMIINRAKSGWGLDNYPELEYIYSDPVREASDLKPLNAGESEVLEESCWWLTGFFPRTVLRDRDWWVSVALPQAQAFWAEYLEAREQEEVVVERIGWEGS